MRNLFIVTMLSLQSLAVFAEQPTAEELLISSLEAINSHQVIMNKVSVPANSALPRHFHPSEEFLYIVSGETTLKIDGQTDIILKAGTAYKIPAKSIHSAATGKVASEIIVFRVHPKGQAVVMKPKD